MSNKLFHRTGALHPRLSMFDLSYEKKFTCDMGQLIPIMCDEVVPGDFFKIGNQAVVRFQPLVAPILHEVNMYVHYFFVPYRLLWPEPSGWQTFISGGVTGNDVTAVLPKWAPSSISEGTLWDYLGFPSAIPQEAMRPLVFPQAAYNFIYNEYYRDQTLTNPLSPLYGSGSNESILYRTWEKDYFTSALPWTQRGTAPALPISGSTSAVWPSSSFERSTIDTSFGNVYIKATGANSKLEFDVAKSADQLTNAKAFMDSNTVDLSSATTFNVNDLRLAFQIQKWMERNARSGSRYTEFLRAHFGISPRDERLQRPEYIGGSFSPIIFSEVLQTSATASQPTPQGNLAGHGIGISQKFCGKYHVKEYGLIMGIMSIVPKPAYYQGLNRQWLRRTKYDFYFPEFAHLSEQAVLSGELYLSGNVNDESIFGYQGRYDEMRYKPNIVCSKMKTTYAYWHLARKFASRPLLNESFVNMSATSPRKDIFAVSTEPGLIISFGNIIKAFRPLPISSEPGFIDH